MSKPSKTAEIEAMTEKIAAMEILAREKEEITDARFADLENAAQARERKMDAIIA